MESIKFKNTEIFFYTNQDRISKEYRFLNHSVDVEDYENSIRYVDFTASARLIIPDGNVYSGSVYSGIYFVVLEEILNIGYDQIYFPVKMKDDVVKKLESVFVNDEKYNARALSIMTNKLMQIDKNTRKTSKSIMFIAWVIGILLALTIIADIVFVVSIKHFYMYM